MSKKKVVIADDEPIIVMNLTEVLQDSGYHVVGAAHNGFSAIDLCNEKKPDVLIIDIRMPIIDGLQVAKYVHEAGLVPTIIIASAFDDNEYVEKASEYGVAAFLVKPIDSKTLVSTLRVAEARSKEILNLKSEIFQANRNLESRKKIERAKGIVMEKFSLGEREAFEYIRNISKENSIAMDLVSEILITSEI